MNGFYWIYLVMFLFLLAYEYTSNKENKRLIYYAAFGFLIVLFVAQDKSVSVDIPEYMLQWTIIPDLTFMQMLSHKFEISFVVLCWILERVFESDRVLLLVVSVMIMLPYVLSFERETGNPMITLMGFVALGMYAQATIFWRQLIAMAIFTFSFRYIRERKFLPFAVIVLIAMTFHKASVAMLPLYFVYNIPITKWLLLLCAMASVVLGIFGLPIIEFGIATIYPQYMEVPRSFDGGYVLLAVLWILVLLSYWLLRDRMNESGVRIAFLMLLVSAMIQPICFAFIWWTRIVLFFRIAVVPITTYLYETLFESPDNRAMALLQRWTPKLHAAIVPAYGKRWFRIATLVILFAVLFVWYDSELLDTVYIMAPII